MVMVYVRRLNSHLPKYGSAILLAKYPTAFANYAMTSSKMEQPALHGVGKNGDCNLKVSLFFQPGISVAAME